MVPESLSFSASVRCLKFVLFRWYTSHPVLTAIAANKTQHLTSYTLSSKGNSTIDGRSGSSRFSGANNMIDWRSGSCRFSRGDYRIDWRSGRSIFSRGNYTIDWRSESSRLSRANHTTDWRSWVSRSVSVTSSRTSVKTMEEDADIVVKSRFPFPEVFLQFLKLNELDPAIYDAAHDLPRYIRLKPQAEEKISEIEDELGVKLSGLTWLPGFFSIPPEVQIAASKAYQHGKIYGMDAASGAAVAALDISPGDHVLDLCAAPGAKLCMIADLLNNSGTLTATDISQPRLAASRTMLLKYGLGSRCRLLLADGTTFSLLPLRSSVHGEMSNGQSKPDIEAVDEVIKGHARLSDCLYTDSTIYGEWRSRKTAKEKKAAKRLKYKEDALERVGGRESELVFYGKESGIVGMKVVDVFERPCNVDDEALVNGYDKVLVDAECTHDGSLKHIYKYEQWGWDTFERRFFNAERMTSLTTLQLQLLSNGFRLLKVGGSLIYSTCSFTSAQNEDVVKNFLALCPNAELREIEWAKGWPCKPGGLVHTLRFDPIVSNTSGLFIAKIARMGP